MTLMGQKVSSLLKKRVIILEETVNFIVNIRLEMQFRADNLLSLLSSVYNLSVCRNLDYMIDCTERLSAGECFSSAWKTAVTNSRLPYRIEEKLKLISMSDFLGTSDKESQREMLGLYEEYFIAFFKKADEENTKYSKICVMLGFVSGFGIFIMVV